MEEWNIISETTKDKAWVAYNPRNTTNLKQESGGYEYNII